LRSLAALGCALALQCRIGLLGVRLGLGVLGLQRLQRQLQLVVVDFLGAATEHGTAHLRDDVFELLVARHELVALGGMRRTLRKDQRLQGVDVARKLLGQRRRCVRHDAHIS